AAVGSTEGEERPIGIRHQLEGLKAAVRRSDGTVWCSGDNSSGQLGVADTNVSFDFLRVDARFNRFY
ncbi:MAG: RCC1 domain-containing protein, partial [Myxococcota bacterium]